MADSSPSSSSSSEGEEQCETIEAGSFTIPSFALSAALSELLEEELVVKSCKGPQVAVLVEAFMANMTAAEVDTFSQNIFKQFQSCLKANKAGKIVLSKLWRNFHLLRLSMSTKSMWQACTAVFHLSDDVLAVSDMTLQLVLRRMMKNVIQQITVASLVNSTDSSPAQTSMSLRELNVVRYIAGYVVLKMKKKFPLHSGLFDGFVVTTYGYVNISTVDEYSRLWVEQVDRGGLCNVSEDFYSLLKEVETVCRQYLDVRITPSEKLSDSICKEALASPAVTSLWQELSTTFPSENMHFLKAIIQLWINIRVHSFTYNWSDVLRRKATVAANHEKALRKSLKQKGTEKDSLFKHS